MAKRFLGEGKSRQYEHLLNPNEICLEIGKEVYAVREDFFCRYCCGAGCKSCKWTGEEEVRARISAYPGQERKHSFDEMRKRKQERNGG